MTYIIVVEVDNKRAYNAYKKGMEDLELIWGQIVYHCQKVDEKKQTDYEEKRKIYEESVKKIDNEHKIKYDKYCQDIVKYENNKNRVFGKLPQPEYVSSFSDSWNLDIPENPLLFGSTLDYFTSIKKELKNKLDLSSVAISPFKMTEHEVHQMIEWEEGNKIQGIKVLLDKKTV